MSRTLLVPVVGFPLQRALLCPNDDTVYDAASWKACPMCQNEERIYLSRLLEVGAAKADRTRYDVSGWAPAPNRLRSECV